MSYSDPTTQPSSKQQGIQSIEIGGAILRALITSGRPAMLKDIARLSNMPPAKAHRYLVSFQRMGLVNQDLQSARYHLGPFALTLGLSALAALDPPRLSVPILEELCDEIGDTGNAISVSLKVGRVLALHDSATGRCFTAFGSNAVVQQALAAELKQVAAATKTSVADLKKAQDKQNEESRRYGIACAGGSSHIPGINGLSAPVFNHTGQMVAAITALGSAGVFNADPKSKEAALVKAAAAKLSNLLGYNEAAGDSA